MFQVKAEKLLQELTAAGESIGDYTLRQEAASSKQAPEAVQRRMEEVLTVMETAACQGWDEPIRSVSGMSGGNAYCYHNYCRQGKSLLGPVVSLAAAMALSSSEVNASMRRIVACPTAGSCGIVPAVLLSLSRQYGKSREETIRALFCASGVGIMIGSRATLAGAEGGCQAECGSAAAMAAAAAVELLGGSPEQAFHAAAMAIKNVLGLVCDPVAGLVEVPCVKRNASGAVNALLSTDLALAGVESYIPFDETVEAMYAVGRSMPESLRETAMGGLAATPTGRRLKQEFTGQE